MESSLAGYLHLFKWQSVSLQNSLHIVKVNSSINHCILVRLISLVCDTSKVEVIRVYFEHKDSVTNSLLQFFLKFLLLRIVKLLTAHHESMRV